MLIVTITGILLLIAGLVTTLLAVTRHRATVPRDNATTQARAILDGRLAAGEIDEDDYRERAAVLGHDDPRTSQGAPWMVTVGVAAIAVAVALLVIAVSSSMQTMGRWGPTGDHMGSMSTDGHTDAMTRRSATTGSLQVDQPGEYRFICTVPSHAAAGMHGTLNVQDR